MRRGVGFLRGDRSGFTLIEILVVVSVLAIMAAMLAPVFVRAQENAKLARCMSHLKEIGQACMIYMSDNNEVFPVAFTYNDPEDYENPIEPCCQAIGGCTEGIDMRDVRLPPQSMRPLWKYTTRTLKIWQCPSAPKLWVQGVGYITDFEWFGNCYPMNLVFGGPPGVPNLRNTGVICTLAGTYSPESGWRLGRPLNTVTRPSRVILFGERGIHQYYRTGQPEPIYADRFRNHDQSDCWTPVCFVDGHVKYVLITGDHKVDVNGQRLRTYGLWDKDWAMMESGWIPDRPDLGMPWGV